MKPYYITVYLNRITIPFMEDFEKTREYHMRHGVDIKFIFKEIRVNGYQSIYNTKLERYILEGTQDLIEVDQSDDATIFVFDQGEWATEKGSKYPLRPDTPNGSCIVKNGARPFITIGTYITDHENGQTWIQITHEIMHSYTQNAFLNGIFIKDVMDTYRENSNPDSPTGNFREQWNLLGPYFV